MQLFKGTDRKIEHFKKSYSRVLRCHSERHPRAGGDRLEYRWLHGGYALLVPGTTSAAITLFKTL
ncbi:MAG: hypothetical protein ACOYK6_06085 [Chthoniobacterales bacterium]